MKLGVIFEDDTDTVVKLDIADTERASEEWVTSTVDLSAYTGKKIAAFGLLFEGKADDYQMNIGAMQYVSNEAQKPNAPSNLKIEKAYGNTDEMVVSWDLADYNIVKQYNVYAVINGKEMYMGGAYDGIYYIKDLYDAKGEVTVKVKAVSADGTESEAAQVVYNKDASVSNIKVDNSQDGKMSVTWEGGQADVTITTSYEKEPRTWTASGNGSAVVEVPTGAEANGAPYTMTIKTENGGFVTYDGTLPDTYCAPYDGELWTDGRFTQPSASEWKELHYQVVTKGNRGEEDFYTRGVASHQELNNDWSMFQPIPDEADGVYVWLVDYNGNRSEEVFVSNRVVIKASTEAQSVTAGESCDFKAEVLNYTGEGEAKILWSVDNAASKNTKIDEYGHLTVGKDESVGELVVSATLADNNFCTAQARITVNRLYKLVPSSGVVYRGESQQFAVNDGEKDLPATDYIWSVYCYMGKLKEGTKVNENGVLTMDAAESALGIALEAKNKENPELVYTVSINAKKALTIKKSDNSQKEYTGGTYKYEVLYHGNAADASQYTWSVEKAESQDTKITQPGTLTIAKDETAKRITLRVVKNDNPNVYATYTVTVSKASVDKTELEKIIADAAKYQEEDYTDTTWAVFAQALARANEVKNSTESTQDDVNAAVKTLNDAINGLEKYVAPDKTLLQKTYDYALTLSTKGVTEAAKTYFEKVLAEAKNVLDDTKATAEEVKTAWDNLLEGIAGLGVVQGDKTNLEMLVKTAKSMEQSKYVQTNWQQLVDALKAADAVLSDGNALEEDVQKAANSLLDAILAQRYKANKDNLEELINKAKKIDLNKYTEESVAAFRTALKNADLVLADETLSEDEQAVVDKAISVLDAAIKNLSVKDGGIDNKNNKDNSDAENNSSKNDEKESLPTTGDTTFLLWIAAVSAVVAILGISVIQKKEHV